MPTNTPTLKGLTFAHIMNSKHGHLVLDKGPVFKQEGEHELYFRFDAMGWCFDVFLLEFPFMENLESDGDYIGSIACEVGLLIDLVLLQPVDRNDLSKRILSDLKKDK